MTTASYPALRMRGGKSLLGRDPAFALRRPRGRCDPLCCRGRFTEGCIAGLHLVEQGGEVRCEF